MRGLSLWQPWASLVAWGEKKIETRHWRTPYAGLVAIHATKAFPDDAIRMCHREPFTAVLKAHGITVAAGLPRGAVVAVARLVDCWTTGPVNGLPVSWVSDLSDQERAFGDYSWDRYGWLLEDVRALPEPIPCRGAQGLWPVPADVLARMDAQLSAAPAPTIIVDDVAVWAGSYRGDQAQQAARVGARNGNRWCHLSSRPDGDPDFEALHAFAARIGMRRQWFQGDHYDLTPARRAAAVKLGAVEVTRLELSMVCRYDRLGRERPSYGTTDRTARQPQQPSLLEG